MYDLTEGPGPRPTARHCIKVTVGTMSSMHLLMKPMTDVVYSSMPSEESWNIFQSVLAKQSCSLASASSDHFFLIDLYLCSYTLIPVFSVCLMPVRFVSSSLPVFLLVLLSVSSSCFLAFPVLTTLPALTLSLTFVLYLAIPPWNTDRCLP